MVISKWELYRKAAGYMLAAANAGIREERRRIKDPIVKKISKKIKEEKCNIRRSKEE